MRAVLLLFFSIFGFHIVHSQTIPDSLKGKSLDYLFEKFNQTNKVLEQEVYSNAIISKAKIENDTTSLIGGYYLKSYTLNDSRVLSYSDSIIQLTEYKSNQFQPASSYITKGIHYHNKRKLKKALDNYIKAYEFSAKHKNQSFIVKSNYYIGIIKHRLGDTNKALEIFKKNLVFYEKNKKIRSNDYLNTIFSVAVLFNELKQLDSATHYNTYGQNKASELKNLEFQNYFKLNQGVSKYLRGEYATSLNILKSSISFLEKIQDRPNLAMAYFYTGKVQQKLNNTPEAIFNFKKVDTLYQEIKEAHPRIRESYEILIDHFRTRKNLEQELKYLNQLINLDSILHDNEVYLNRDVITKYDIPKLIADREEIINTIKKKDAGKRVLIYILIFILLVTVGGFYYQFRKKRLYKKRFLHIIESNKDNTKHIDQKLQNSIKEKSLTGVSEKTTEMILKELEVFEKNNAYLKSDLTLPVLAKKMNTNAKYLSKVISYHRQKSFINYVNELRVNYAIDELRNNYNFRKYTLIAIANEVGFKKTESFSRAFQKNTGITPAFFIKELSKK